MKNTNNNQEDLRKSVKKNKKLTNNILGTIIKIILIALILVIVIFVVNKLLSNKKIDVKQIDNYNYFISKIDEKSGVIDRNGNKILNEIYESIQIPNPEEDVFICMNVENENLKSKVLNEKNKEILTKYKEVQAIPNNNTSIQNTYQTQILTYKENGKLGIIDLKGNKKTNAIYNSIETLENKDGILKVNKDDKFGLIDLNGNEIVETKYNMIMTDGYYNEESNYENAGYIVNIRTDKGYRYGYLNNKGKAILDTVYTNIKRITEKKDDDYVYLVTYKNGKAGVLKNGQTLLENEYEDIEYDIENNIFILQKDAKQGVYDFEKNMILPIQYENISFAGKYINAYKDGEFQVFDLAGILQNKESNISLESIKNGKYNITINRENNYGIMDSSKNCLVENKYSYIEYAFDDYFIAILEGKSGVINSNGEIIIPFENEIVQNIRGTNIIEIINSEKNKLELYNNKLEKVSEYIDAKIYIKDDYLEIEAKNKIEYFDLNGNKKEAKEIFKDNNIYPEEKDGKWGYVTKEGNVVLDYKYEMATNLNEYGFASIKENGKWGVINKEGQVIKNPSYEIEEFIPSFIGEYYEVRNVYEIPYYTNK